MSPRRLAGEIGPRAAWVIPLSVAGMLAFPFSACARPGQATVVVLTQVPCQFLEPEGVNRGYKTAEKADCDAINAGTAAERVASSKPIELKPGRYVFRVKNASVPYELGFWLRGDGLMSRAALPSVSGGGLMPGKVRDYEIELKPGNYLYSCPLNTTPDYRLVVK